MEIKFIKIISQGCNIWLKLTRNGMSNLMSPSIVYLVNGISNIYNYVILILNPIFYIFFFEAICFINIFMQTHIFIKILNLLFLFHLFNAILENFFVKTSFFLFIHLRYYLYVFIPVRGKLTIWQLGQRPGGPVLKWVDGSAMNIKILSNLKLNQIPYKTLSN